MRTFQLHHGSCLDVLRTMEGESIQCVVTSPPYWGLRDYGTEGQLGLERTPEEFVSRLVEIFREVQRVLRKDGTLWLNLGDCYATGAGKVGEHPGGGEQGAKWAGRHPGREKQNGLGIRGAAIGPMTQPTRLPIEGLKPKDLVGIPWMVAFALRADGWYLRSDIVWAKRNCMPESVTDRPTRSHEYIFLLSKSSRYFYDHEAIKEPCVYDVDGTGTASRKARARVDLKSHPTAERAGIRPAGSKDAAKVNGKNGDKQAGHGRRRAGFNARWDEAEDEERTTGMRNKRDVWTVEPAMFAEAHFATFSPELIKPCILAGSKEGDTVLDPFCGAGTSGLVALRHGRKFVGIELNPGYVEMARRRIYGDAPLLNQEIT